jgi:SAM-dependent methyltransferase
MATPRKNMMDPTTRRLLKQRILKNLRAISRGARADFDVIDRLAAFAPISLGSLSMRTGVALQGAQQVFPFLSVLAQRMSQRAFLPVRIENAFGVHKAEHETAELAMLFERYGSDKSSLHDYHLLYGPLLGPKRNEKLRFFEFGLGSNHRDVPSNMGTAGKPGASLRAFRDFLPNAAIFGADIDRRILFAEDRIETFYVDQTELDSFAPLTATLGSGSLDFIIDDGLHAPNANIATMIFALEALRPGGTFVVEDIGAASLPVWQTVAALVHADYEPRLIQAKNGILFIIQKPGRT